VKLEELFLLVAGLAIDAVAAELLAWEYEKLVSKGFTPAMPYSVFHAAYPATKAGLAAAFGLFACLAPFEEEAVFRVVPYILGGFPFALIATAAWVLAHYHKLYSSNAHLSAEALKPFSAAYLISLALPGVYYAYTVSVNPLIPYALHAFHNSLVVVNLYRMAKPAKRESKLLKQPSEQKREERAPEREGRAPVKKAEGPPPARLNRYKLDGYAFSARPSWVDDWLEAARSEPRRKAFKRATRTR